MKNTPTSFRFVNLAAIDVWMVYFLPLFSFAPVANYKFIFDIFNIGYKYNGFGKLWRKRNRWKSKTDCCASYSIVNDRWAWKKTGNIIWNYLPQPKNHLIFFRFIFFCSPKKPKANTNVDQRFRIWGFFSNFFVRPSFFLFFVRFSYNVCSTKILMFVRV